MTWTKREARTANTGLAKVAVQCFADTFVVNQSLVLRMNICGENRHLRQARKRYGQVYWMTSYILNNNYYIYKKVEISNHSKNGAKSEKPYE